MVALPSPERKTNAKNALTDRASSLAVDWQERDEGGFKGTDLQMCVCEREREREEKEREMTWGRFFHDGGADGQPSLFTIQDQKSEQNTKYVHPNIYRQARRTLTQIKLS